MDLIVLDLMLPGLGGLDICRELRRINNTTPILVISARDSEIDRVPVSYTHLRAHETKANLVCRLLLEREWPLSRMVLNHSFWR